MRRRTLLAAGATVWLGLFAGCAETQPTVTDTAEDSGATPTATTTGTPATTTEPGSTNRTASTTRTDDSTTASADPGPAFGTLFSWADSYAIAGEFSDPDSDTSGRMTGRYHGDDFHQRIVLDATGESFELYAIDDDTYVVFDENTCVLNPSGSMRPDTSVNGDAEAYGNEPDPEIHPTGTDRIDGADVYVFEVTAEDATETVTLYVSVATGYLRRVETDTVRFDYDNWGEVSPISPPEMDCQTLPS